MVTEETFSRKNFCEKKINLQEKSFVWNFFSVKGVIPEILKTESRVPLVVCDRDVLAHVLKYLRHHYEDHPDKILPKNGLRSEFLSSCVIISDGDELEGFKTIRQLLFTTQHGTDDDGRGLEITDNQSGESQILKLRAIHGIIQLNYWHLISVLPQVNPREEAVVFFSSASTGPPKAISHSHASLLSLSYNIDGYKSLFRGSLVISFRSTVCS